MIGGGHRTEQYAVRDCCATDCYILRFFAKKYLAVFFDKILQKYATYKTQHKNISGPLHFLSFCVTVRE